MPLDHLARLVLQVSHDVCNGIDFTARHLRLLQYFEYLVERMLRSPVSNDPVEFLRAPDPPGVIGQRRIFGEAGTRDGMHHALEYAIAVGADDNILAVAAQVGVRRHTARQRGAGALE